MDLPALAKDIEDSHVNAYDSAAQTKLFMRCMQALLLDIFKDEIHLFHSPQYLVISGHTLIMFSFPGTTSTPRVTIEARFERSLASCARCVDAFYVSLAQIRARFVLVRKIAVAQVLQFRDIVDSWVLRGLERRFAQFDAGGLSLAQTRVLMHGCLANALLLRTNSALRARLAPHLASDALRDASDLHNLLAAVVLFLVSGNDAETKYAEKEVCAWQGRGLTLQPHVLDEVFYHFYRLQDARHFTPEFSRRFWHLIDMLLAHADRAETARLLNPLDLEAMSVHTNIRMYPMARVLFNNLMADPDTPLPNLLAVLRRLLDTYGAQFWKIADDCHFLSILETVPPNPSFLARLSRTDSLNGIVAWAAPFVASLAGLQKHVAAVKLANGFLAVEGASDALVRLAVSLILQCVDATPDAFADAVALLKLRDVRVVIDKHARSIVGLTRAELSDAQRLVHFSLRYDIAAAAQAALALAQGNLPGLSALQTQLWAEVQRVPVSEAAYAAQLLDALQDASHVVIFKEKKNQASGTEVTAAARIYDREARALCASINSVWDKLALVDPQQLALLVATNAGVRSVWSGIFNSETTSAALSIVSQIQDTEGRYEAVCYLLNASLAGSLRAVSTCVRHFTELRHFEPCPKTLRILMDVVRALTDPLSGILNTRLGDACHAEAHADLRAFWEDAWRFLLMIYRETLAWANVYHLSDLIEFTRDTLDISHLLLDAFRVFFDFFADPALVRPLFAPFMSTFTHVIVWLRLGDLSLLKSCVELVFKGFDLAKELGVVVDPAFLALFAKYGARARKFNSKLTELQRDTVLAKASEFDARLVADIVDEVARDAAARLAALAPALVSVSVPQKLAESARYAHQTKPREPRQTSILRFGVATSTPPVAPPPVPAYRPSNLDTIRSELKNTRTAKQTPAVAPVSDPAPPRPAGFNKAPVAVGRSLNALKPKRADSDTLDEDDVDTSDLFYSARRKPKVTEVDLQGNPVAKVAAQKKVDPTRREEERMRLRLSVNLKPLYLTILRLNYNSDSEFPGARTDYRAKRDTYTSYGEYVAEMEPLLMLECWQGIQASRTTGQELPFELLVGSRTTCDGFFDVFVSAKKSVLQQHKLGDLDLIVMGYVADRELSAPADIAAYLRAPTSQTCLGKIREVKHANPDYCDVTVRVYPQGAMMGLLTPKSVVVGMRVVQMVTLEREYASLKGLAHYDLCDSILAARPVEPVRVVPAAIDTLCAKLGVNASQATAILGSSQSDGFLLIQGPPGTGKTKTILGIVGHFLLATERPNAIAVPRVETRAAETRSGETQSVPKVLICAPSNAAVDELVRRLKDGVRSESGAHIVPKIIRLGRSDVMSVAARDFSLEELVDRQLRVRTEQVVVDTEIRQEHSRCLAQRDRVRDALKHADQDEQIMKLEQELRQINARRAELGRQLDEQRERASVTLRTRDIERRRVQAKLIADAQVICATLSGSAHDFLAGMYIRFDQVIIDEACQCVELLAIIPLRYGCRRCVMVGDPNQLPPTVLSQRAAALRYGESLFVRMQRNHPDLVYLLDVQYRMHPEISRFPSLEFYHGRLTDGPDMRDKNTRLWHAHALLSPYRFFDIAARHLQSERSKSYLNHTESRVALELVEQVMQLLPGGQFAGKVGVISPYKEQIRNLREVFQRKFGASVFREIDFNTVDGFQGQEKEIIIISCVRASDTGSVGFLSDVRRMNVALTRAGTTLWVLGNRASLKRDRVWNKLICDAEARGCVTVAKPGFTLGVRLEREHIQWPERDPAERVRSGSDASIKEQTASDAAERNQTESRVVKLGQVVPDASLQVPAGPDASKQSQTAPDTSLRVQTGLPADYTLTQTTAEAPSVAPVDSPPKATLLKKRPANASDRPKKKAFVYTQTAPAAPPTASNGDDPRKTPTVHRSGVIKPRPKNTSSIFILRRAPSTKK